ncbi:acyltransferase family protein [Escherichia coli]|uniref:acyltransferase family protein n=1 Tax=Escherichia coli TaxID=562 RepID=UPI001893401F|nr:acyltransferase family protein [Escherichia coli]
MKKYDYIDVLRALAILGVIAVHASQNIPNLNSVLGGVFNYGQLGVQLFFIASAVTLCMSMESRGGKTLGISIFEDSLGLRHCFMWLWFFTFYGVQLNCFMLMEVYPFPMVIQ